MMRLKSIYSMMLLHDRTKNTYKTTIKLDYAKPQFKFNIIKLPKVEFLYICKHKALH